MQLYTIEQLSQRISRTPEGYILCQGSVLARTGEQIYGAEEMAAVEGVIPVDGMVRVERTPEEVFRAETITSANIKSLVNDHHDVDPTNWKELTDGIVFNARRGVDLESDLLLGDILITDPTAMDAVDAGKVELSCGYDAEYRALGPGRAAQFNIIINHVALVEKGRCGPRCAIRDAAPKGTDMSTPKKKGGALSRFLKAFATRDEAGMAEAAEELEGGETTDEVEEPGGKGGDTHVHVHVPAAGVPEGETVDRRGRDGKDGEGEAEGEAGAGGAEDRFKALESQHEEILDRLSDIEAELDAGNDDEAREMCRDARRRHRDEREGDKGRDKAKDEEFKKQMEDRRRSRDEENREIEGAIEAEAPAGTGDRARKAHDSAFYVDAWRETVSAAEILAPGISIPTFDHAAKPARTVDTLCQLRAAALKQAGSDPATKSLVETVLGGRTLDAKLSCEATRAAFFAAAALKRESNNGAGTRDRVPSAAPVLANTVFATPAEINRRSREQRARQ